MKLSRILFALMILIPPVIFGSVFSRVMFIASLDYLILFYLPIIYFIRMRTIGMTWKECFKSLIPFYGLKYQYKLFFGKTVRKTFKV